MSTPNYEVSPFRGDDPQLIGKWWIICRNGFGSFSWLVDIDEVGQFFGGN